MDKISNNRLKELLKNKQKKYRNDSDYILVEGNRLIDQLHRNSISIIELFCLEKDFSDYKYLEPVQITSCDKIQLNRLSTSKTPQNVIAMVKKPQQKILNSDFLLYLDNVSDPGNLGTIFRTASALGITGIVMSPGCCDVFNPKALRSSLGAIFSLPFSIEDYRWVKASKSKIVCTVLEKAQSILEIQSIEKPVMLVIGSEAHGISEELVNIADHRIYIPMSNSMESLNVSVASAISMFYLNQFIK